MPGEMLINRVIHNLVNQVVETQFAGRADVHRGSKTNCLQPFQHANAFGAVFFRNDWLVVLSHPLFSDRPQILMGITT